MMTLLKIEGMSCAHCRTRVEGALSAIRGVSRVEVSLENGSAEVHHETAVERKELERAVTSCGYKVLTQ